MIGIEGLFDEERETLVIPLVGEKALVVGHPIWLENMVMGLQEGANVHIIGYSWPPKRSALNAPQLLRLAQHSVHCGMMLFAQRLYPSDIFDDCHT
jgi:hypothetical protein